MGQARLLAKGGEEGKPVRAPLALGASFQPEVLAELKGDAAPVLSLISGRPDVLAFERGRLWGRAPGLAPVLIATSDGVVIDFYHVWVARATRLALRRSDEAGKDLGEMLAGFDFVVGESVYLTPRVYYEAQELTGDVDAEWSVAPPLVEFLRRGVPGDRRLLARRAGEAKLRVAVAGVELELPIRVLEPSEKLANASRQALPPNSSLGRAE